VKVFPLTGIAVRRVRLLLGSVTQGVTEVTVIPLKVMGWDTVEVLTFMATTTTVVGLEDAFSKAETETPVDGTSVAPMR
jgi:hypothetical protein